VVAYEPAALIRSASGTKEQPRPEIERIPHAMNQDVVTYRAEPSATCRPRAFCTSKRSCPWSLATVRAHLAALIDE
jgi:hypothetical protein